MFIYNTVTEDTFKVCFKFSEDSYIIDYYGSNLLVVIGDLWKIVED